MDQYLLTLTLIGAAAFTMAWMPSFSKFTGISYSIAYVAAGWAIYSLFPNVLPNPLPQKQQELTLHLTELVVIISIMGTGIKIDRAFSLKAWSSPIKLILIAMPLCIALAAFIGYQFLGLDLAAAILLGAVLAPTDPVLAADVQVGPPNETLKSETKFSLTSEAGMNDGMAFPFTWLAITLALITAGKNESLVAWFTVDLLYKTVAGLLVGYLAGKAVGYLIFKLSPRFKFLATRDGFLAVSLTLLVYGVTEMLHGYGFIAVFVSAINLRHYEKEHDFHHELHSFTDQIERLMVAILLILFGGTLASGILAPLNWKMVVFSLGFLLLVRPISGLLSLATSKIYFKEKLAISFFGIRGMGSIFYLTFAFGHAKFGSQDELWAIIAFTILISIFVHGITATPIMKHLKQAIPKEEIPT